LAVRDVPSIDDEEDDDDEELPLPVLLLLFSLSSKRCAAAAEGVVGSIIEAASRAIIMSADGSGRVSWEWASMVVVLMDESLNRSWWLRRARPCSLPVGCGGCVWNGGDALCG